MAKRISSKEIAIVEKSGTFEYLIKRFSKEHESYDFEGISMLRKILSNEKARILHTIKSKKPVSIYNLARILGRDFKSVNEDIHLLEKFGFIDLIAEKSGRRERLRPVLIVDSINIKIEI